MKAFILRYKRLFTLSKKIKLVLLVLGVSITIGMFQNCSPTNFNSNSIKTVTSLSENTAIKDIKNDMGFNEAELLNPPIGPSWTKSAFIVMGNAARGDASPYWWTPDNFEFKSSKSWNAITPWFVLFAGVNHAATNTRVKISNIGLFILEKSKKSWKKINTNVKSPTWAGNWDFNASIKNISSAAPRTELDGGISYKLNDALNAIHGGMMKFEINGEDIDAVFARLTTQLILDDPLGPDDRSKAQLLMSVGVDYYPSLSVGVADYVPMNYNPGVGGSRFGLVKEISRTHYFATIDTVSTNNKSSDYLKSGASITIPLSDFESNLPPCD